MNAIELRDRNDQIVTLKARGLSYSQIAKAMSLHRTTVMRVMKQWREAQPKLRTQDPLDVIDEMLEGYQADLNELAVIANTSMNESARIGAINARMAARDRIIALLQSTGVLPHDLGKLKVEIDVRYIAVRFVAVMEKWGISEEIQRELLAILRGEDPDQQQLIEAAAN